MPIQYPNNPHQEAEIADLRRQLAEAQEAAEALDAKVRALAPHGTCGCSYDRPGDLCMHHSPQITALRSRVETLTVGMQNVVTFLRNSSLDREGALFLANRIEGTIDGLFEPEPAMGREIADLRRQLAEAKDARDAAQEAVRPWLPTERQRLLSRVKTLEAALTKADNRGQPYSKSTQDEIDAALAGKE